MDRVARATGKIPKGSRPSRQRLKALLREKRQGFVHIDVLRENIAAVRALRAEVLASQPDVVIAVERGGWFLTDVVSHDEPGIASKVERVGKVKDKDAHFAQIRAKLRALITDPARKVRRIAVIDAYMGGFNAEDVVDLVFSPLLEENGQKMPDLEFGTYWIRESMGFESRAGGLKPARFKGKGPHASRIAAKSVTVPWIFGDDVALIVDGEASAPINVFDSSGDVIATIPVEAGETTYDLAVRVLNGEGIGDLL